MTPLEIISTSNHDPSFPYKKDCVGKYPFRDHKIGQYILISFTFTR